MFLLIRKNRTLLLPKNSSSAFSYFVHSSSSSTASKTLDPSLASKLLAEFLIKSCGFSSQNADRASKKIAEFASIHQVHSVTHFLKHHGFTDAHICRIISRTPRILSADVNKTLQPNLQTLREMGFTEAELHLLIASSPYVLATRLATARLEFWQNFLGTNTRKELISVFRRNQNLIGMDVVSGITPKIALLKKHGLSDTAIVGIVKRGHCFITRSSKSIEMLLKTAKELGFDPRTPMFGQALSALCHFGEDSLKSKMEILRGYGWSDEELLAAVKKTPFLLLLSEENIREKMEFLVGRAGCEQSYIASHPLLLMFSLEKRLKPRQYVMEVLKSNENEIVRRWQFSYVMSLSEKKFVERFVLRYKEKVPKIHEHYIAACAGEILV